MRFDKQLKDLRQQLQVRQHYSSEGDSAVPGESDNLGERWPGRKLSDASAGRKRSGSCDEHDSLDGVSVPDSTAPSPPLQYLSLAIEMSWISWESF